MSVEIPQKPTWIHNETIDVPSEGKEKRIGIRRFDWDYCIQQMKKNKIQPPRLHLVFSYLLGISTTTFIQSLSFAIQNQFTFFFYFYLMVFIFSTFSAVVFIFVDRNNISLKQSDATDIVEFMEAIEKTFD